MKRTALYAGSFDPFTRGHADIVARGLCLFDEVIVGIGTNDAKRNLFSAEERLLQISRYYADEPRVRVLTYTGLTVSLAQELQVGALLEVSVVVQIWSTSVRWQTSIVTLPIWRRYFSQPPSASHTSAQLLYASSYTMEGMCQPSCP